MNYKIGYNIKDIKNNITSEDNLNHTKLIAYTDSNDEPKLQPLLCLNRDDAIEWCDFLNNQNLKIQNDYDELHTEIARVMKSTYKNTLNLEYLFKHLLDEYLGDETNLSQYIKRKGYLDEYNHNLKAIRNTIKNMMETIEDDTEDWGSASTYELMFSRKHEDLTWEDEI